MSDGEGSESVQGKLFHRHLHNYKQQCSVLFHVSFISLPFHPHSNETDAKSYPGAVLMAIWFKLILLLLVKIYSWWSYIQPYLATALLLAS